MAKTKKITSEQLARIIQKGFENTASKQDLHIVDKKIVGDVDYENVEKIVEAISPVPGGVGPMTIVSLFQNLLEAQTLQT